MRSALVLGLCLLLAACGRPLTPAEMSFVTAMQGDETDLSRVRLVNGHFAGSVTFQRPVRPRLTCQERLWPPSRGETVTVSPGATVLFNRIFFRKDLYRADFLAEHPQVIDLTDAMLLAHEMVHVWQWQNRARTGYTPWKAAREHGASPDPYLFAPDTAGRFLDYGYEQQGAIMEEYLCCRLLDPEAPRTARMHAMISAEMPLEGLDAFLDAGGVRIPWAGAETEGICR